MERIPIKTNPKLFDRAAAQIQQELASLTWLDHIFGICERLTDVKEGKRFNSANVYAGEDQYTQVMPCKELGNFAFLVLKDPQVIGRRDENVISGPFSLIVWYDMRTLSFPLDERNREAVKAQILGVLNARRFPWLSFNKIYERPESVFADFSYDHTNNQFLMAPYAGLRLEGEMKVRIPCAVQLPIETWYLLTSDGSYYLTSENERIIVQH